MISQVLEAR